MAHLQYDGSSLRNLAKALTAMPYGKSRKTRTLTAKRAPQCSMVAPDGFAVRRHSSLSARMTIHRELSGSYNSFMTPDGPFHLTSIPKLPSVLDS
jgi:hypothetical protein